MSASLRYEDASVGYDAPVVSDVTLEVGSGEVLGLIGPNGAGKTTLLRSVTRGARVLAGTVNVDGRDVRAMRPLELARVVAVLPQSLPSTFAFSARQFVEMGRHAHVSRFGDLSVADRAAVERALALTDTMSLADRDVSELSGGDLQRLTLAQALAQEPRILLLDEPTSHLDLNHRLQVLDVVRSLADEGLAVLAVFHDLDMAARYSDHLALVAHGAVVSQGRPEQVLTKGILRDVFGVAAVIGTDPVTRSVQVLPVVRSGAVASGGRAAKVLVISGSGTGASLMRRLVLDGFEVSAGALASADTDGAVADALELPHVAIGGYAPMSGEDEAAVRDLANDADVVAVVATPFGPENVANLRAVTDTRRPVVMVGEMTPAMDFSRGEALALWNGLARAGARTVAGEREARRVIEEVAGR